MISLTVVGALSLLGFGFNGLCYQSLRSDFQIMLTLDPEAFFHKGDPLLPLYLFKKPGYLSMVIMATVGSCIYYSQGLIWPQQVLIFFPGTPVHNGWLACVLGSSTLAGQLIGSAILRIIPKTRWLSITSCAFMIAFSAAMVSVQPGQQAKAVGILFMLGFFVGVIEIASLSLLPITCPTKDIGSALGALGSIRSSGAAVATAIYSSILKNKASKFVPQYVGPVALDAGVSRTNLPALLSSLTAGTVDDFPGLTASAVVEVKAANALAWEHSFRFVWYAVAASAICALMAACFTIDYGKYFTDDIARKIRLSPGEASIVEEKQRVDV